MSDTKLKLISIIEKQPEDSTFDEIIKELLLARMIERGEKDYKEGRVLTDQQMAERIKAF